MSHPSPPPYAARGVYEPPHPTEPGGCREVWIFTRAAFSVLFWPLMALGAVLLTIGAVFFLLAVHPALALVPIAALTLAVYLFARWEQRRSRPPGV